MAKRASKLAPEDSNIRDALAECLYRNGDIGGVVEQVEIAQSLDPESEYLREHLERFSN